MPTFLDTIQRGMGQTAAPPTPQGVETQRVLRARSGKARTGAGPAGSRVAEGAAIEALQAESKDQRVAGVAAGEALQRKGEQQARAAGLEREQIGQQAELTRTGRAAQTTSAQEELDQQRDLAFQEIDVRREMTIDKITNDANQQMLNLASERQVTVDNIFSTYKENMSDLELQRERVELEHLGAMLALQDKEYLAVLDRHGREMQLQNDINFQQEIANYLGGQELSQLTKQIQYSADEKELQYQIEGSLAKMGINHKLDLAMKQIQADNTKAMIKGVSTGISAAATGGVFDGLFAGDTTSAANTTGQPAARPGDTMDYQMGGGVNYE